ncbi:SDR family oxidoreductase [Halomonas sp. MC140]|nr:SDR family oxidoreductase [Halomonas sp. MC140]MDN7132787.1 SDR family oxidoreductase [Halomonas sp. MC140]
MRLNGMNILITAAGQGMGRAAAIACANEGANVIATDRDLKLLAGLQGMKTLKLDVTSSENINAITNDIGPLDGLFNCAGIVQNGTLLDLTDEEWETSLNVNITSMIKLTRACLPSMLHRAAQTGSVSILNMASMASSIKGFPNRTAYGTTKAAVIGMTKSIAADYVTQGIRCNALCPGTVDTPSLQGRIASAADPVQAKKDFISRQPMGRLATIDDITPAIIYLLSNESRFITGQSLLIDGGVTI